jgi:hypothetical protein
MCISSVEAISKTHLRILYQNRHGMVPPGGKMKSNFKALISVMVWILFIKGLLLMPVTFYTFGQAYLNGEPTPLVGVASCAGGTFALLSACLAAWIRKAMD